MAKRQTLIPWVEAKKAKINAATRLMKAETAAKAERFKYEDDDIDQVAVTELECEVLRITDVELPNEDDHEDHVDATAAVLWGDYSWTRVKVCNLMTTEEGRHEVSRYVL